MHVTVVGAGVAGLACAVELAERGAQVEVLERGSTLGAGSCSWHAGGMLAPWCELAGGAERLVGQLGGESIAWWNERFPGTVCHGSLVVAHARDAAELTTFVRRAQHYTASGENPASQNLPFFEWVDEDRLARLEPALAGRFRQALFFPAEAHLDPRAALQSLQQRLEKLGVQIRFGVNAEKASIAEQTVINCSGLAARSVFDDLRGVKGEMLLLHSRDVSLTRPVRVLHPRIPLYVVPRGNGIYMVGATTVESDDPKRITVRSTLELLSAAYALHPAFAEAHIVEIGTGVRPAFEDHLPRLRWRDGTLYVNGLYRHGFLLAPALARMAAEAVLHDRIFPEVMDEDPGQRKRA